MQNATEPADLTVAPINRQHNKPTYANLRFFTTYLRVKSGAQLTSYYEFGRFTYELWGFIYELGVFTYELCRSAVFQLTSTRKLGPVLFPSSCGQILSPDFDKCDELTARRKQGRHPPPFRRQQGHHPPPARRLPQQQRHPPAGRPPADRPPPACPPAGNTDQHLSIRPRTTDTLPPLPTRRPRTARSQQEGATWPINGCLSGSCRRRRR